MEFYIDNRQRDVIIDEGIYEIIGRVIRESLLVEGLGTEFEISISLVDNEEIRDLNSNYRGLDKETDVLSFPIDDEFGLGLPLLGDIIISAEKALEQSEEYGHSFERELAYLVCHSMFHLMGYDHMNKEEKEEMRSKEKKVLKNLGIYRDD